MSRGRGTCGRAYRECSDDNGDRRAEGLHPCRGVSRAEGSLAALDGAMCVCVCSKSRARPVTDGWKNITKPQIRHLPPFFKLQVSTETTGYTDWLKNRINTTTKNKRVEPLRPVRSYGPTEPTVYRKSKVQQAQTNGVRQLQANN
jgi:hypothetical protein